GALDLLQCAGRERRARPQESGGDVPTGDRAPGDRRRGGADRSRDAGGGRTRDGGHARHRRARVLGAGGGADQRDRHGAGLLRAEPLARGRRQGRPAGPARRARGVPALENRRRRGGAPRPDRRRAAGVRTDRAHARPDDRKGEAGWAHAPHRGTDRPERSRVRRGRPLAAAPGDPRRREGQGHAARQGHRWAAGGRGRGSRIRGAARALEPRDRGPHGRRHDRHDQDGALRGAIAKGYPEPDPRDDLSGLDVARKALSLGRLLGFPGELGDIAVESLVPDGAEHLSPEEFLRRLEEYDAPWEKRVAAAAARGGVLRYRAIVTPRRIRVGLVVVDASSPMASLNGTDNQFIFTTMRYKKNPLVITGPGAGPAVTAGGILNDVLKLAGA